MASDPPSPPVRRPSLGGYPVTRVEFAEVGALMLLPFLAAWWMGATMAVLIPLLMLGSSIAAYLICAADKRKARQNRWRIPEATMHLVEAVGGWPGSYLAQRRYRHKITKRRYQVTFWFIVATHQVLAFGTITHWRFLR